LPDCRLRDYLEKNWQNLPVRVCLHRSSCHWSLICALAWHIQASRRTGGGGGGGAGAAESAGGAGSAGSAGGAAGDVTRIPAVQLAPVDEIIT
jgi:hypothetical protein